MVVNVVWHILGILGGNAGNLRVTPAKGVLHYRPMVDDSRLLVHFASL